MKFIAYYRVSTKQQGQSGLGLEAQRKAVLDHIGQQPLSEFVEVESGRKADRPQLVEAMKMARLTGSTLVVAKLDRLSRNAAFLNSLLDSGLNVRFADMPHADRVIIGIMAQLAQWEAEQTSKRTIAALAAAKERGVKLGGSYVPTLGESAVGRERSKTTRVSKSAARRDDLLPIIAAAKAEGCVSLRAIADYLNARHITTAMGGQWYAASVKRLLV